ncbi:hypothetical protein AP1_0177 [Aeromonas phage AP1]|nr:hypothetical protein AP1_0177 [Aeromonas phage AP1]
MKKFTIIFWLYTFLVFGYIVESPEIKYVDIPATLEECYYEPEHTQKGMLVCDFDISGFSNYESDKLIAEYGKYITKEYPRQEVRKKVDMKGHQFLINVETLETKKFLENLGILVIFWCLGILIVFVRFVGDMIYGRCDYETSFS